MFTKCLTRCSFGHQGLGALRYQFRHCSSNIKVPQSQVFKQQRLAKLKNTEKYPHYFATNTTCKEFCYKYQDLQVSDTCGDHVALTGMVTSHRSSGKKLKFVDIESGGQALQLKISRENYDSAEEFHQLAELLSRGDKLGR